MRCSGRLHCQVHQINGLIRVDKPTLRPPPANSLRIGNPIIHPLPHQLTRATASRELAPPPPTELSLPQLCLAVSAKEVLTQVAWRGWAQGEKGTDQSDGNMEIVDSTVDGKPQQEGEERVALFRKRKPLSYFAVDCRPKEQVSLRIYVDRY